MVANDVYAYVCACVLIVNFVLSFHCASYRMLKVIVFYIIAVIIIIIIIILPFEDTL